MSIKLKTTDSKDKIRYTVQGIDYRPLSLEGATVRFLMADKAKKTLILNESATIASASEGTVEYKLSDLSTLYPGTFNAEFHVEFADGSRKIVPAHGYIEVTISESLDASQTGEIEENIILEVSKIEEFKDEIVAEVDGFRTTIGQAQDATLEANEQAEYAKTQGDRAKVEADRVAGMDVSKLTAQLAETTKLQKQTALLEKLKGAEIKLSFPEGFTWTDAPINIYKSINGKITTDFDVSDFQHVGASKTYYVNVATGHNTNNDGLSEGAPLKSIWAAITKPDVDIVIVAGGYYDRANGFGGNSITRSLSIKAKSGETVKVSISDNLTWTKTVGMTNVYQVNRSSSVLAYDKKAVDEYGDYYKLAKKTSIAEVDAEKGSWYTDGVVVYVHTPDSRPADTDVRVMLDLPHVTMNGSSQTLYMEGINLEGGKESINTEGITSPQTAGVFLKNCTFKYTNGSNVLRLWGIGRVFSQNCVVAHGRLDGFNYHLGSANVVPDAIEVNCIGRHNGLDEEGDSNNGSTMHDGGRIIRVNGEYFSNKGPNVIDVNEGGQSWCVGTLAYKSVATVGTISNTDFKNGNVGASKMWLDSCVSHSSNYSIVTSGNGDASKTYIRNLLILSNVQMDSGTTLEEY
ncbi:BppU family phage baseplate upper protein [Cytobacillus kochii]|uniref:BppU family phage baseplate upper protein n=1 Tax=Cytobacillus kochii TaxID=859143 RepID=UPI003F7E91FB